MTVKATQVEIENVLQPGKTYRVDAQKYAEMRRVFLTVVGKARPGQTVADISKAIKLGLSAEILPGGATAGWWMKAVQLDLEAKGIVAREDKAPVRLYLV